VMPLMRRPSAQSHTTIVYMVPIIAIARARSVGRRGHVCGRSPSSDAQVVTSASLCARRCAPSSTSSVCLATLRTVLWRARFRRRRLHFVCRLDRCAGFLRRSR
jgi:hypothetical protein